MITIDAGSPILVEVQFSKAAPFKGYVSSDPTSTSYNTYDPNGNEVLEESASGVLTKLENDQPNQGRYYCIVQTTDQWVNGTYKIKVTSSYIEDTTTNNIDIKEIAFIIKNGGLV